MLGSIDVLLLFGLAALAGVIDAMAGGGGLLTIPGLMAFGLDPLTAMATNKCQGVFGTAAATLRFWRAGQLPISELKIAAGVSFVAAALGAYAVTWVDATTLKHAVPVALLLVAGWVAVSPRLGNVPQRARLSAAAYVAVVVTCIGFYDGFLGPGTGSFFALSGVALLGLTLTQATARAKLLNLMSNAGPLLFFMAAGYVVWPVAGIMLVGNIAGGWLGAHLVVQYGA
ncbi:MAG: TSUP family transporter, partial [Alphaproteobacteria bacterium]